MQQAQPLGEPRHPAESAPKRSNLPRPGAKEDERHVRRVAVLGRCFFVRCLIICFTFASHVVQICLLSISPVPHGSDSVLLEDLVGIPSV